MTSGLLCCLEVLCCQRRIFAARSDLRSIYIEQDRKRQTGQGDEAGDCNAPVNADILALH